MRSQQYFLLLQQISCQLFRAINGSRSGPKAILSAASFKDNTYKRQIFAKKKRPKALL